MKNHVDPSTLHWFRRPNMFLLGEDHVVIETEANTSFHSLAFDSTNAHGMVLDPMCNFGFTVRVDYRFSAPEDECGVLLKRHNNHWAKAGIECRTDELDLACTLYSKGYGDRSCRQISDGIRWMYFRILYWNGNARFQYSFNGGKFSDMRWFHFGPGNEPVTAGIYACSGKDAYFDCTFSQFKVQKIE
ncbi:MAG: DUF1349 domain-containing protein [Solobacterium sp.]|nr:DUF1349 domain-containing protein [Solobacterium sp.]